jgi:hypothetical protein
VATKWTQRFVVSQRVLVVMIAFFLVITGLLFIPAGTVDWLAEWVFIVIFGGFNLLVVHMLARHDPELLEERMSPPI